MEPISLKLDQGLLKNMDKSIKKHNFSTRTEFIRSAIRGKLEDLSKGDLIKEFLKFKGKAKKKISDEEFEKNRELAFNQLIKEKGWN